MAATNNKSKQRFQMPIEVTETPNLSVNRTVKK